MLKRWRIIFVVSGVLMFGGKVFADTKEDEIRALKAQVQQLLERIEKLEEEQEKVKEEKEKAKEPVVLSTKDSKLTLKGRFFVGYFSSEREGSSYHDGSFEIPESKVQLTWKPLEKVEVVNRMSFNNASFNNLDYFYLQVNQIIPQDEKSRLRIGKMKIDFGEETWINNPVEHKFITNSASNTSGYDEGIELYGNFIPDTLGYAVSITNGNSGTGSDNQSSKATAIKIFGKPVKPLYLSGSYYLSNNLGTGKSEMSIAGLNSVPSGATNWNRNIWEIDAKIFCHNFEFFGAYGSFADDITGADNRKGDYYFFQGVYNFTPKFYAGLRYSSVKLDDDAVYSLNGINANEYIRPSVVLSYKISKLMTLKAEYSWNKAKVPGADDVDDDLFAIGLATQF